MQRLKMAVMMGLAFCATVAGAAEAPATLVLIKGQVMTMNEQRTLAQAVAVRGNRIVAVGSDEEIQRYVGKGTRVIDLQGKTLLPGFIDGHVHPVAGGDRLGKCSTDNAAKSVDQIVKMVRESCMGQGGAGKWIEVVNVNPANFVATAADLDRISTTQPVILAGIDGHTSWVNNAALRLAKIADSTPDPDGGQIERDAKGHATGFLKDSAQSLATDAMPKATNVQRLAKLQEALALLRSKGITTVQEAWASEEDLGLYDSLEKSKKLNMRVRAMLASKVEDDEKEYKRLAAVRNRFKGHPLVRADGVKVFADGVIEFPTQSAAMIHPYLDANGQPTSNVGGRYFDVEVLKRYVTRLDKDGFMIFVHSIGDFTTHAALDAFEAARQKNGATDNRHAITHLQIVDQGDFPRFAQLGVYANMQLFWAVPSEYSVEALKPYISADNYRYMYPAGSLKKAGSTIYGGSDWPVDSVRGDPLPNTPLAATQAGMLRMELSDPDSKHKGEVLNADERVDLDTMLSAYTITAAKAMKQERTTGSIEVGKLADLVALDSDVLAAEPKAIGAIKVRYTVFNGAVAYQAAAK
ncbi:amidohydrolase family protein [Duganella sp. FT135W]|uniref:Amidohydrolase family protein n=1 Tax=Duganella flavida TaxID=2692175 RepID=A0A6L8KC34_9BURK|nr:amidohydrolase [Duganella flavida]MYM24247.1 amidohydrolase family protein [Duganella flavida]